MGKLFTLVMLVLALLAGRAEAKVTIEVLDPAEGKYLVTYELKVTKVHSTKYTFPKNGFTSRDKKVEVVSVTEKNTDQQFEYEILPSKGEDGTIVPGKYKVKAKFINPIPQGGHYILEYKVILYNKEDCYIVQDARWLFQYRTTHDAFFILPKGHAAVYSNYPVLVYEKAGRTVLQQKAQTDDKRKSARRKLLFKTFEFRK